MNSRKIRDSIRFAKSVLLSILYIPHFLAFLIISKKSKDLIISDIKAISEQINIKLPIGLQLLYQLNNNRYYRTLFYHRLGPIISTIVGWYMPGDRYFIIANKTIIGKGMWIAHPYATVLNAKSIGDNFHCIHCTTLGATSKGEPIIGDNVTLGANVTIIGPVRIGDNVTIGAGSVVVKDIPNNCVAAGNPAKVIRYY